MRGKVIKTSAKNVFVQLDKNNQICDLFVYDKSQEKDARIKERIRGKVFDTFHGRPLYTAWNELIEFLNKDGENE
jgi:hypothetical protein